MNSLAAKLDELAEAIRNINPFHDPKVHIIEPRVGLVVGTCINCGSLVKLRQPWLTKTPIVNDGWYILHCENKDCHNYYGMELREGQWDIADFVEWDDEHLIQDGVKEADNIIPFSRKRIEEQYNK